MPNPESIRLILVVISFLLLIGMFQRPFYGLISYLIIMMTRPGLYYPALGSARIELVVAVIILVVIFASGRLSRIQIQTDPICKMVFILFGVMALSMLQAFDFTTSWDRMNQFLKVFLFFIMVVTLIDDEKDIEVILWAFSIITTFIAYTAIYNYLSGNIVTSAGGTRTDYAVADKGMGAGHVALANITLQAMAIPWYLGVCNQKMWLKALGGFIFLLCLYGVVISGSRGGFVGILVLFVLMVYFSQHRFPMIICGLAFMFIIPLISATGYMEHMDTILGVFTGDSGVSGSSRISGLRNGFEMMLRRPVLGVGPGCYPVARKAWFGWGLWSHNLYGQIMGDLGLSGVIVFFLFLRNYLKKALSLKDIYKQNPAKVAVFNAIIVSTSVRLALGMVSHSLYIFFWYLLAAIVINETRFFSNNNNLHLKEVS